MGKLSLSVVLNLLLCGISMGQTGDQPDKSQKPTHLPGTYSVFSESDVLRRIFEGYDPTAKRVSSILNYENRPTGTYILQSKLWHVGNDEYLVVLTGLEGYSESLCDNCMMDVSLAVLKKDGNELSLVARQDLRHSYFTNEEVSETFGTIPLTGHGSISLDLAPYRLTDSEMLIGVRIEEVWPPERSEDTNLLLFRVDGKRLRNVFQAIVMEREYSDDDKDGAPVLFKTSSTLSTIKGQQPFYDLVVEKTTISCAADGDGNCDSKSGSIKQVKAGTEVWRFDGEKFNQRPGQTTKAVPH